ncbi:SMAD/FHA domain-containing protein [Nadsonia fulvescens var. elongata DSM 6958]|uniref:SMAD/FHA domain-containing protein n=1 Tax=Nadsonia fulvescens var. elongata DSM 6958 TaxID=857566 RepID=A0A1E3PMV3_9ASCO|nr:SMAD/FHA domain-containing protein [Nadsonia fulvescens var. elongata DSM 6958]
MRYSERGDYRSRSRSKSPLGKKNHERTEKGLSQREGERDRHEKSDRNSYRHRTSQSHEKDNFSAGSHGSEKKTRNKYSSKSLHDKERIFNYEDANIDSQTELEDKYKPNYATSGTLSKDTNLINGVLAKYNEPEDSCLPGAHENFQLFVFNGSSTEMEIKLNQRSHYLFGRDDKVAHVVLQNPTCSKQHAAIQFRKIIKRNGPLGEKSEFLKAYIIDLCSSYGTRLNGEKIPSERYIELKNKDLIQFARSKREYVFMQ